MKAIRESIRRLLRGPLMCAMLERLGVDARSFWLLVDLFGQLSERSEILDQLGRNGIALKSAAWMYFAFSALASLGAMVARPALGSFAGWFLAATGFLLLMVLLMETGNSLVNPVEAAVLAHQPISGATYTAAKLTHLITVVLYLVAGLNVAPALAGLTLKGAPWFYPLAHMGAALAIGFAVALFCCALFGWLIRFIPARRLKAAAQLLPILPLLLTSWPHNTRKWFAGLHVLELLPAQPEARLVLGAAAAAGVAITMALGIRSLSADYLIRVSGMTRGGAAAGAGRRTSWLGAIVARWFGGQPARAGFAFTSRMMRRDWQFRRQLLPMAIIALLSLVPLLATNWWKDPFLGPFTPVHLLPHILGIALFMICFLLPYGTDYKGAWIFLLAPVRATDRFARGVHALLWIVMVVVPHAILLPLLAWSWGAWHAGLFTCYSMAAASLYLALELRLIEGAPFSSPVDTSRGAVMMPMMILSAIVMALAVGLQYFFLFRSPALVLAATAVVGAAAWVATRAGLAAFAVSIRFHLGLASAESGTLYTEIG